ncbi:MAG: hypothetical protein JW832_13820 [Deltaproteobacteria bacterium]|nr:hypothetical protein [Deltaproteobacteria bacterium]
MQNVTRRVFTKKSLLFSFAAAVGIPAIAAAAGPPKGMTAAGASAMLDKLKNNPFTNRTDLADAIKSLYMTYDTTSPYQHKFNEVLAKQQLRSLQFHLNNGTEKAYVQHSITTAEPLLKKMKALVEKEGGEQGLYSMFEGTSTSYQLFEHINVAPGRRSFPCPYRELLANCKKYLLTFSMDLSDVCTKYCTPLWTGIGETLGISLAVEPGDTCTVALTTTDKKPEGGAA